MTVVVVVVMTSDVAAMSSGRKGHTRVSEQGQAGKKMDTFKEHDVSDSFQSHDDNGFFYSLFVIIFTNSLFAYVVYGFRSEDRAFFP